MGLVSGTYHILSARNLVRDISRNCVTCQRVYAKTVPQQMGNLPASRVKPSPPLAFTGIDFAGPILLRRGHTRKPSIVKAYIALFICLSTRAIHLELVFSLSTADFIAVLRRFVSRRGTPHEIISDNGTNFVGANNELQAIYKLLESSNNMETLQLFANQHHIKWKFNPVLALHFGGLWEAGVKSTKTLLRKILFNHSLNLEEYSTILCKVEAVLNSRPLQPLHSLPDDGLEALTPGHFLVGRPLTALPQGPMHLLGASLKRWNLCQRVTTEFWQGWSKEYLQSLQKAQKWIRLQRRRFSSYQRHEKSQQRLASSQNNSGSSRQRRTCRVVKVKTMRGTYTRLIHKFVLLLRRSPEENTSQSSSTQETSEGSHPPDVSSPLGENVQAS